MGANNAYEPKLYVLRNKRVWVAATAGLVGSADRPPPARRRLRIVKRRASRSTFAAPIIVERWMADARPQRSSAAARSAASMANDTRRRVSTTT